MSDLGLILYYFFDIGFYCDEYGVFICKNKYAENTLKQFFL